MRYLSLPALSYSGCEGYGFVLVELTPTKILGWQQICAGFMKFHSDYHDTVEVISVRDSCWYVDIMNEPLPNGLTFEYLATHRYVFTLEGVDWHSKLTTDFEPSYMHLECHGNRFVWHMEAPDDEPGFMETESFTLREIETAPQSDQPYHLED